jgi:outer membrane lipoprotein SlyB
MVVMNGRSPLYSKIGWLVLGVVVVVASAWLPAPAADAQSQTMQRILYGEVVSAERITIRDRPTGRGAQTGSTVGAVAGYALADGRDRWLGALVGGVLGGAAGNAAEKAKKKKPGWELIILLDNGEEVGVQVPMNKKNRGIFTPGNRVRLMSGPNGETRVTKV